MTISHNGQLAIRGAYAVLLALALILVLRGEPGAALFPAVMALALDPFDQDVRWADRPRWQHAWLFAHMLMVLGIAVAALPASGLAR